MSAKKAPLVLARSFTKIPGTANALIGRPAEGVTSSPNEPDLVLICGWMDAQLPHLYKYTEAYNKLYPGATQILVRSQGPDWLFGKEAAAKRDIPIAKVVQEFDASRVLLHVFSNGGCWAAQAVSDALGLVNSGVSSPIPARAVIFDSCPGDSGFAPGAEAFTAQIRHPIGKPLAVAFVYCLLAVGVVYDFITGKPEGPMERTYIYSESDLLVRHTAVEAHATKVRALGIDVTLEKFAGTPHVNHLKGDPIRYWDIVDKAWQRSRRA